MDYINDNGLEDIKLWITGYSRASSVADLTGVYINEHIDEYETTADDLYIYTFEAPAVSASNKVYDNIHETRNKNDIINYVYPESRGICSNGKKHWIGDDKTIDAKYAEIGFEGIKIKDAGTVAKDEFAAGFIDFLSEELSREKFSGDFDGAIGDLLELYFGKTPEERKALSDYFNSVTEQFSGVNAETLKENEALSSFISDDVYFGIFDHNSDKMYEKMVDHLKAILTNMYEAEKAKEGYKRGYDVKFKERSLYHIAAFVLNINDLLSEHRPQNNRKLVKALDSYYTEGIPTAPTDRTSYLPETGVFHANPTDVAVVRDPSAAGSAGNASEAGSGSSAAQNGSQTGAANDTNPATGAAIHLAAVLPAAVTFVVIKKKQ